MNAIRAAFALLAALGAAVPAFAQITPRTPRPDWGVFGGGTQDAEQRLVLTFNFGGGYEDDLTENPPPTTPGARQRYTGPFGSAGAQLSYTVDKEGLRGGVSLSAASRNYRQMDTDPFIGTYSLRSNIGWDVSDRGSLSGSFWAGQYVQNLAPGFDAGGGPNYPGIPPAPTDPGVWGTGDTYRGLGSSVHYNQGITDRLSGYGGWSYYLNDAWKDTQPASGRYGAQNLTAGVNYSIGKGLSARFGYSASLGGFDNFDYRSRAINFGLNYNGSLSPTRQSSLSFSTGVSGVDDLNGTTHYYFVGRVTFNYEIGRSWSAGIGASRSTDFYQTLGQPSVRDSVNGNIGGLVGRRVSLSFGGGWHRGTYAGASSRAYDATSANASVQYAISRMFALSGSYYFYRYTYAPDVILPPGYSRNLDRQTVLVRLNVWLPLWTKARRP